MKNKSVQITITGNEQDLNELLAALAYISKCCMIGHSDSIKIDCDGDGAANIKCEMDGKLLQDVVTQDHQELINECIDSGSSPEFSLGY